MFKNRELLLEKRQKNILIAAHRGTVGGNIIPNTELSFKNALLHGADIVEMDIIKSTDGVFYAFHDGEEKKIINKDIDLKKCDSRQIDSFNIYNSLFLKTNRHLERAEDVLLSLKGKCFINIDRSWFYWKDTINFLRNLNMENQLILKSPVEKRLIDELECLDPSFMYMPIIDDIKQWEMIKDRNINIVAVELVFNDINSPLVSKDFLSELKQLSILLWVNSIMLDDDIILSAKIDDNLSIKEGFDKGWGNLIEMGFDIIQTDWPALLEKYINSR